MIFCFIFSGPDRWCNGWRGTFWSKPKTMKLVFVASTKNTQNSGVRAMTGWLEIRINCPEWSDMSIRGLLFQWVTTIKIQLIACLSSAKRTSSSFHQNVTLSRLDTGEQIFISTLNNNHSPSLCSSLILKKYIC